MPAAAPWSPRASAWVCFAAMAVFGYAALRLYAAPNEPDPRTLGPSVHVGYYWRVGTAIWWGALAGIAGWRFPAVGPAVAAALPWIAGAATIAAVLVP